MLHCLFTRRRPPPPKRNSPYRPPPPIGPSGMGIGHQRPEEGRRGQGGRALRPIRNIMKSSKPHHPMRGRPFNMLRVNQRSSETDGDGYDDDSQLEWRNGISNLDWHPRKKQVVLH